MIVATSRITVTTRGGSEVVDITPSVEAAVRAANVRHGVVIIFVAGSTASVTTTEFEPGLQRDIPAALERLVPANARYHHDAAWHDGNGHAHIRASLLGPSLTVPLADGELLLGTWQQIVIVDHDTRPRERAVVVQVMGEQHP